MKKAKRILILSNECLSKSTSNGRTLSNFLVDYPKECLAQFSVQSVQPNFERCDRYFCVTDKDALNALIKGKRVGRIIKPAADGTSKPTPPRTIKRTAWTMLMRDLVWSTGRWKKGGFWKFVEDFRPEVLLLQAGDCAFMFSLARKLSKKHKIPLVIYNSEAYYFKTHDYFLGKGFAHWMYPIFRRRFCHNYRKTMKQTSYLIYNCSELKKDYDKCFDVPSQVLYTATQMTPRTKPSERKIPKVAYLGKMELLRHRTLIELAEMLGKLDKNCRLEVYGKLPAQEAVDEMKACKYLNLHGLVDYDEVKKIMCDSDILVHAESFDDFYRMDSKYAFSTKIADTLACGTCFFCYVPEELACSRYLAENDAAYLASNADEALRTLKLLLEQPEMRGRYFDRAQALAVQNHCADANAARFFEILNTVTYRG
ncbi:MAG: glycosyltransferase [Ruminococcaceae bacterium]|nr:glycosyltransferase [Oscillospiraceae bacterium]